MAYRLLVSIDVVELLERLPARHRRPLRQAIVAIGDDPLGKADATDWDEIGRLLHISVFGDYAITYWIDDADRHVKIMDIHASDR
jgi:mRNA-degrading endonuclease RelE of RelBE toxin-antitoxin system